MFLFKSMLAFAGFVVMVLGIGLTNLTAPSADESPLVTRDKQFYTCIHEAIVKFPAPKCSSPDDCKTRLVPVREETKNYVVECMANKGLTVPTPSPSALKPGGSR